jgi:hypothetical protein
MPARERAGAAAWLRGFGLAVVLAREPEFL